MIFDVFLDKILQSVHKGVGKPIEMFTKSLFADLKVNLKILILHGFVNEIFLLFLKNLFGVSDVYKHFATNLLASSKRITGHILYLKNNSYI